MALISEDDDSADTPDNLLMAHGERVCANSAPVLLFFSFEEINSVAMDQQPCGMCLYISMNLAQSWPVDTPNILSSVSNVRSVVCGPCGVHVLSACSWLCHIKPLCERC